MKLFFLILALTFFVFDLSAQIKKRSDASAYYTGAGYKFIYFTDSEARTAYPFFDLSSQAFAKELSGFFGVILNEQYAVELSPSYIFSNDYGGDDDQDMGFYFGSGSDQKYYVPVDASMYALPVNIRGKYFPFGKDYSSPFNQLYFGAGAGPMYISEEMSHKVYEDESRLDYLFPATGGQSFWTYNVEFIAGLAAVSTFGVGFDISYRIVPLSSVKDKKPLVTSIADNFNSFNAAINVIYRF